MEETKKPSQSKTIWANGIVLLVALLGVVAGSDLIAEYPVAVAGVIGAVSVLNIALRFLTGKPLSS